MSEIYCFLLINRLKKKGQMYKRAWQLTFDPTLLFYILALIGYIGTVIILEGNVLANIRSIIPQEVAADRPDLLYLVPVLPLMYMIRAFQQPGILFSSSFYMLTMQPYDVRKIWVVLALERWTKSLLRFGALGLIYAVIASQSLVEVLPYFLLLFVMQLLMTWIEWRFFQQSIWKKLLILVLAMVVNMIAVLWHQPLLTACVVFLMLGFFAVRSARQLLADINWKEVTSAVDFKIWKLPFLSQVTKTPIKKEKQRTLWQHFTFWQRPFIYTKATMYHRLWLLYVQKNSKQILQLLGALLLLVSLLGFIKAWLFYLGLVVAIHIYTSLLASAFRDQFTTGIVPLLPWDLAAYLQSFRKWAWFLSAPLLIPLVIYVATTFSGWQLLLFFVANSLYLVLLEVKLERVMGQLDQTMTGSDWWGTISSFSLFLLLASYRYPAMLLIVLLVVAVVFVFYVKENRWSQAQK